MNVCRINKIGIIVALLLYWKVTGIIATCPTSEAILPCRCSLKGKEIQIWCSHSNLPQIMEGIKSVERNLKTPIDEFILENNQLPALPGRFFGNLQIVRLMLRHNSIERVSNGWLNELENSLLEIFIVEPQLRSIPIESLNGHINLIAITIQSDEIKYLPDFSNLLSLKYLSVQSAALAELQPNLFKHLPKLQNLHVNGGIELYHLEAGLFDNLISLKNIDLSRNGIKTIHLRALSRLPNLSSLKLSSNRINDVIMIGRVIKDLENLKKLRLDRNEISLLPEGCFVDLPNLTELHLNDNRISEIQYGAFYRTPNLKIIYMHNNNLLHIHPESFLQSSGSGVESLYLYNNNIERIEELRSILDALPTLKFLDISNNKLMNIPYGALRGHGTIEQLHINNNQLRNIERDALMAMPALRELRLANNSLTDAQPMPFWNLPGLKGLDLSQNQFRKIDSYVLNGLPSLRRLDFSQNSLIDIDQSSFINTPMLETLNISYNDIVTIQPMTFTSLNRLFEVDASYNHLTDIITGLPKIIERLSLRGNDIINLPPTARNSLNLPNLRMIDMSNNNLENIQKYTFQSANQLRVLSLARNNLQTIENTNFLGANRLELLHLQDNQLVRIDDRSFLPMGYLRDLNLQANQIDTISDNLFSNNTRLEQLNLSRNLIRDISPTAFDQQKSLEYLDLSGNLLNDISISLSNLVNLRNIDLSFNQLNSLATDVISSWRNVIEIRLSNNKITELKYGTLRSLPKLQYLDLSSNDIQFIEPGAFKNLPELQELVLADNKLIELKDHVFENLPGLLAGHLQHNRLRYISPDSFFKSPSLVFLNISLNDFRTMENVGLRSMRNLEVLDLSGNSIKTVSTMPLQNLNWLVELKMDNNQICKIHGSPFETMPRLRVLSMRNNRLQTMKERTFRNLRGNIAILDVDGNPIMCTCEMLWLSVWLHETNFPNPGPTCQNGKLLRSARFEKTECNNEHRSVNHLPLLNEHGDIFTRQLSDELNEDCDIIELTDEMQQQQQQQHQQHQRPLPGESEYFYDQYIDYPSNDTSSSSNNNNKQNSSNIIDFNKVSTFSSYNHRPSNYNNTILNTNLIHNNNNNNNNNHSPYSPKDSQFTFFGYPIPSISIGRFFGGNGRNVGKIEKPLLKRGKVRMYHPNDNDFEKYLNQESQYHDVTARNSYIDSTSEEGTSNEDRNLFRTSFTKPTVERGGFKPIVPGQQIGGFMPMSHYKKNSTQSGTHNYQVKEEIEDNMVPIVTELPRKTYSKSGNKEETTEIPYSTISTETPDTHEFKNSETQTYFVTENTETIEEDDTSTIRSSGSSSSVETKLETEFSKNLETLPNEDSFLSTSTSETILLIPPANNDEELFQFDKSKESLNEPITTISTIISSESDSEEIQLNRPILKASHGRSRSTVTKVLTPKANVEQNLPTAEEFFRTTINPQKDTEMETNEFATAAYIENENVQPKKSGMDWYYDNYRKTNKPKDISADVPIKNYDTSNYIRSKTNSLPTQINYVIQLIVIINIFQSTIF